MPRRGAGRIVNESYPMIEQYFQRRRLAELGFHSSLSELDMITGGLLLYIDQVVDQVKEERAKHGK